MSTLTAALRKLVGERGLIEGEDLRRRAASITDSSAHEALALVRPANAAELSAVMAWCHQHQQPVVVQGGMTGLVDGATAAGDELAVSLERMNTIDAVDTAGRTITVGAGVTIQALHDAAAEHQLMFGVDWGARGSAMVGGGIATNAGGNAVLRYGMMREQVLGLEVVLADGTVLSSMNQMLKNNTGYDLKQLFVGSEGTLGIVTRAVLRLRPVPAYTQTALVAANSYSQVLALLDRVDTSFPGGLGGFEVMWSSHFELIVNHGDHQWILPEGHEFYVLVEVNGADERALSEQLEQVLGEALEAAQIADAALCHSDAQRQAIWAIRDDVDTFMRVLDPPLVFDVSMPVTHLGTYVEQVNASIEQLLPHARGIAFGHLGDSNLHFCWTTGNNSAEEHSALCDVVYQQLQPYDGSISAEHGIGRSKRKYLNQCRSSTEIQWMERIKKLFDPHNLLNPGRVVDPR